MAWLESPVAVLLETTILYLEALKRVGCTLDEAITELKDIQQKLAKPKGYFKRTRG